jgi:hypothetical protein
MGKWPQTKYYPSDFPAKITVIRRHHPLEGHALERLSVGKAWVVVRLGDGSSMKLPRGWTDADGGPCTELIGHSPLCLGGLRELLTLVKALRDPIGAEVVRNGEKIGPLLCGVGGVDVQAEVSGLVRGAGPGEALGGVSGGGQSRGDGALCPVDGASGGSGSAGIGKARGGGR